MKIDTKILDRLNELIERGEAVRKTRYSRSGGGIAYLGDDGVNYELAHQWGTSCLSIIGRVFGTESDYYKKFDGFYAKFHDFGPVTKALGILRAAKEDYEHDYLFNTRTLIEAEVFDDFLEQAEHLFASGYYQSAAVIAGSVLEDGLRKLCKRNSIPLPDRPKLDQMNADLAKHGVYSKFIQKQITVLADLRNKAAHGLWDQFGKSDVEDMLRHVRSFMEGHFA
jgi:hypothetical protein